MSTPNSQPSQATDPQAGSSPAAKKELFPQINAANAMGLAANLFDKLRKQNSTNTPPTAAAIITPSLSALSSSASASELTSSAPSTSSSSSPASTLFSNLALSFSKSRNSASSGSSPSQKSKLLPESLAIVDDDPVDDDYDRQKPAGGDPSASKPSKSPIPVSQSDISLSTKSSNFDFEPSPSSRSVHQDHHDNNEPSLSTSQSFATKPTIDASNPASSSTAHSSSSMDVTNKPINSSSSSSSLLKFGSELANSARDEAETFRKRILTKKKSIELSLESIRNKVSPTSTSTSTTTTTTTPIAISPNSNSSNLNSSSTPPNSSLASLSSTMSTTTTTNNYASSQSNSSAQDSCSYVSHTATSTLESILDSEPSSVGSEASDYLQNNNNNETLSAIDQLVATNSEKMMIVDQLPQAVPEPTNAAVQEPPQKQTNLTEPAAIQQTTSCSSGSIYQEIFSLKVVVPVLAVLIGLVMVIPSGLVLTALTYSAGFLCGSLATLLLVYLAIRFGLLKYVPVFNKLDLAEVAQSSSAVVGPKENENITNLRNLLIQTAFLKENKNFDGVYKGWMNELREHYDPENYFLNKTRSVFINLDGTMLRLQTTSSKVPKRATWNEQIANCTFSELRIYDLSDCEVFILPKELVRKRYWSKKYPLCLKGVKLTNNSSKSSSGGAGTGGLASSPSSSQLSQRLLSQSPAALLPSSGSSQNLTVQPLDKNTLILFARTDREKEEWFKLFKKSAARTLIDSTQYLKQQKAKLNAKLSSSASNTTIASQPVVKASTAVESPTAKPSASNVAFSYSATSDKIIYKILDAQKPAASSEQGQQQNGGSTNGATSAVADKSQNLEAGSADSTTAASALSPTNTIETQTDNGLLYDKSLAFLNTFLIRTFADFFNEPKWINLIQTKIQKKLSTIKVPYFMEELRITGMDLGCVIPLIKQASEPWYDEKGLWVHLDIDYSGGLQMSLATKLNLMKLKSNSSGTSSTAPSTSSSPHVATAQTATFTFKNIDSGDEPVVSSNLTSATKRTAIVNNNNESCSNGSESLSEPAAATGGDNPVVNKKRKPHSAITHSDEEDSPESSGDEYVHTGFNDDDNKLIETANASKKLLSFVNKIAASNYFQKATENKYIKMAMENVSNCQLLLTVEVRKISGTLALNIPPHPSDRLWYGFVTEPTMVLVATPQVGEKEVSYSAITDWIALKLKQEFQKILVFPNMDDLYIPLLNSEINNHNW